MVGAGNILNQRPCCLMACPAPAPAQITYGKVYPHAVAVPAVVHVVRRSVGHDAGAKSGKEPMACRASDHGTGVLQETEFANAVLLLKRGAPDVGHGQPLSIPCEAAHSLNSSSTCRFRAQWSPISDGMVYKVHPADIGRSAGREISEGRRGR